MKPFAHSMWGFALDLPRRWIHRALQDSDGFAEVEAAFSPGYTGPRAGHLIIDAEWNGQRRAVEPIWRDHVTRVATMLGARRVGSAPWRIGAAQGFEVEIVLPQKQGDRLWLGMLAHELILLKILVCHPRGRRPQFEPAASACLRSLRFLPAVPGVPVHALGLPLPPGCTRIDPNEVLTALDTQGSWEAFQTPHSMGAVQAFYWREAPASGWKVTSFQPFPGDHTLPFARVGLERGGRSLALGILPGPHTADDPSPRARLAFCQR